MGFLSVFSRLIAIFLRMNHQLTPGDQVEEQATVAETLEVLRQSAACLPIAAVFCGLDTGVMLADVLAQHLQLRGNRPMARGVDGESECEMMQHFVCGHTSLGVRWNGIAKQSFTK